MNYYSGIGSRETPPEILDLMEKIGEFLAKKGMVLRSGGANGADSAFEIGCDRAQGQKEIYLPWKGFNKNKSDLHLDKNPMKDLKDKAYTIAERYHPAWESCNQGAKRMMARNGFQVLGIDLNTPVDFVVCWTPYIWKPGIKAGGTAQALRIAYDLGIKIFNLKNIDDLIAVTDHLQLGLNFLESTTNNLFENPVKEDKCYFSTGIDESITCCLDGDFDCNGFPIDPCPKFPCEKYNDIIKKISNERQ